LEATPNAVFAMRQAVALLRSGQVVVIAPEGEVSPASTLQAAQPGIGYLAAVTGAPVLPVASTGQENLFANARRLRRTSIRVEFGEPFVPPIAGLTPAALRATSDTIMRRVAAMLPRSYRGVYSDCPSTATPFAANAGKNGSGGEEKC
jgi:1-acyl-sn-glycerol-3-phosphate acyltransferase